MKKLIIFLILLLTILPKNIYAESIGFYEGEYLENIWINKLTPDHKTIYYQRARTFRQNYSDNLAYCIEPFNMFNESGAYNPISHPRNLTDQQRKRIQYLTFLGYGSKNRQDMTWYAVTQLLIWQTAEPLGKYYFTDSLNGKETNIYDSLMDELNKEVEKYINYEEQEKYYSIVLGNTLRVSLPIDDYFTYYTQNEYAKIIDNELIINDLPLGHHEIEIIKSAHYHDQPLIFYQAPNSQNLVTIGNVEPEIIKIIVDVKDTKLEITKLDYDTKSKTPSGSASLKGTIYQVYDENMQEIAKLNIDENNTGIVKHLPYGKYYIKELTPGEGYIIDNTTYSIELTQDKNEIFLSLEDKVIKGKLKLNKVYILNDNEFSEENITFLIYDDKNELVTKVTTNELGMAETYLPYGIYTVKQHNTKDGYKIVEPFTVNITDEITYEYNLKNYKIPVPNTYTNKREIKSLIRSIYEFISQIISTIFTSK